MNGGVKSQQFANLAKDMTHAQFRNSERILDASKH